MSIFSHLKDDSNAPITRRASEKGVYRRWRQLSCESCGDSNCGYCDDCGLGRCRCMC
ncbi:hypothetical protein X977_4912 [Burkholderia pseudomallei MSHR7504]|nr:hypothetical protein X977_4912 [Burkholderia pseudomallei MSHR7504]